MSERERWIVYPLLFFALGAALRDKYTQQVQTENLHAAKISCEEISIIDSENARRIVAQLGSRAPTLTGIGEEDRFGYLVLRDSEDKEQFGVTHDSLHIRRIDCEGVVSQVVAVIDPADKRVLAQLGSVEIKRTPTSKMQRFGLFMLNNQAFLSLIGMQPLNQAAAERPAAPKPAEQTPPEKP